MASYGDFKNVGVTAGVVSGGEGDDLLVGGIEVDTFVYSGGNDTIVGLGYAIETLNSNYYLGYDGNTYDEAAAATVSTEKVLLYTEGATLPVTNYPESIVFENSTYYTGWAADGDNFLLYTNAGSIRVLGARDQTIDANGFTATMLTKDHSFDGSTLSGELVVIGSSTDGNVITGGRYRSSIWGGDGNNDDVLNAGIGSDYFIYNYGNGNDVIFSAGANDTVAINNVTDEDGNHFAGIREISMDHDRLLFVFNDFNTLDIRGQVGVVRLDGQYYFPNYTTGEFTATDLTSGIEVTDNEASNVLSGTPFQDVYVYGGGNDTIVGYQTNEPIILDENFTNEGWVLDNNDLVVVTNAGSVRIDNARDRIVDVVDIYRTDESAYYIETSYYIAGKDHVWDASADSGLAVLIGSDSESDVLTGGSRVSTLWGGNGGDDILIGGSGYNTFVYNYGDGNDIASVGSDYDVVDFSSMSLYDVADLKIEANRAIFVFGDYGSMEVDGRAGAYQFKNVEDDSKMDIYTIDHDARTINYSTTVNR